MTIFRSLSQGIKVEPIASMKSFHLIEVVSALRLLDMGACTSRMEYFLRGGVRGSACVRRAAS